MRARLARAAARCAASGFSSSVSSRAATARVAASMSAICAGKRSRNSPEMRHVTSTRARPIAAVGSTSMPVTRPVAASQTGRQPIRQSPCAISSPPVRKRRAAPQVDHQRARHLAVLLQIERITSSAASRPRSMAVCVGSVRGSAVKRLRPVGSTSRRPRCGEPAGPGATRRPSSAARRAARSARAEMAYSDSLVLPSRPRKSGLPDLRNHWCETGKPGFRSGEGRPSSRSDGGRGGGTTRAPCSRPPPTPDPSPPLATLAGEGRRSRRADSLGERKSPRHRRPARAHRHAARP